MTFSRAPSRALLATSTLLVVIGVAVSASAQRSAQDIASARQLYNDGIALRDKGDLSGALEKFRAAHALGNTPITGIELCRTYAALRQPIEAREVCLGIARIAPIPEETERSQEARRDAVRIAEAEKPKIGAIHLTLSGVPVGWQPTVTVDGDTVPPAALREPRAVNPGSHSIVAKIGSGPEVRASFETKEGESRELHLAVEPPSDVADDERSSTRTDPAASPSRPSRAKTNVLAAVSFSIAGGAALVGAVGGVVAISSERDLSAACKNKLCGRDQWPSLDSARTWGTVSTVFFVVAGVGLTTGIVALLTSSSRPAAATARMGTLSARVVPTIGLGGAGIHGSF